MSYGWDPALSGQPRPPQNGTVTSAYIPGVLDLRWDDPTILAGNSAYTVVGVNIYRSDVSDRGPFYRINALPVGGSFYRDQTENIFISREVIDWNSAWVFKGDASNNRHWTFRTQYPIVKHLPHAPYQRPTPADSVTDVTFYIDGVEVPVESVFGPSGEVTLINVGSFDVITEKMVQPPLPTETSTVEISYYTNRNRVRSGLDASIHYRLTTVALSSTDPTGYTESELSWCPPISTTAVEALDYIWREAIRRNQWILQQGGERVKIFIRRQSGVPCTCKMDPKTREFNGQPSNRCHVCFVPGTLIRSEVGYRPIESIKVGDKVLSSDGLYHEVTQIFETPFSGDLVSLFPSVSANPILVTPEHPFMVLRGSHCKQLHCGPKCNRYIEQGDGLRTTGSVRLLPSGRWWARVQVNGSRGQGREALGTYDTQDEAKQAIQSYLQNQAEPGHLLKWDEASNLSKWDWLVAKWPKEIKDVKEVHIPQKFRKNTVLGSTRLGLDKFDVDLDFLWMLGLYLAEGCKGTRGIVFALHRDETEYQERLVRLFTKWGYHPKIHYPSDSDKMSACVIVNSTTLAEWFPDWLGSGCQNKHIPEEFMCLPKDKTWAILQGIYDGDGWKGGHEITLTSEVLSLQVSELLHKVGEQPLIRRQIANVLTPKGNKRRVAYCTNWAEEGLCHENRKGRWVFQDEMLTQVRKVGLVPYSGFVYNLEVEGDHTYVVQGVVTHNCYGTGFIGGYEGPFETIIAPDDAERRIVQLSQGKRKEHTGEVFMGPSPVLTQRDFIVKQTNERYSIGPVRRPSNRGNLLQQHFNIGYLDEGDIRYKVPIDGTSDLPWPETRYGFRQAPSLSVDGEGYRPPSTAPDRPPYPVGPDAETPMGTDKAGWDKSKEQRGRTPVWENQNE